MPFKFLTPFNVLQNMDCHVCGSERARKCEDCRGYCKACRVFYYCTYCWDERNPNVIEDGDSGIWHPLTSREESVGYPSIASRYESSDEDEEWKKNEEKEKAREMAVKMANKEIFARAICQLDGCDTTDADKSGSSDVDNEEPGEVRPTRMASKIAKEKLLSLAEASREENLRAESIRKAKDRAAETPKAKEKRLTADLKRHAEERKSKMEKNIFEAKNDHLLCDSKRKSLERKKRMEKETYEGKETYLKADSERKSKERKSRKSQSIW